MKSDQTVTLQRVVEVDDLASPFEQVDHSLPFGLLRGPQLQVGDSVVGAPAVLVMDGFGWQERTPDVFGHSDSVFEKGLAADVHDSISPAVLAFTRKRLRSSSGSDVLSLVDAFPVHEAHAKGITPSVASFDDACHRWFGFRDWLNGSDIALSPPSVVMQPAVEPMCSVSAASVNSADPHDSLRGVVR